MTNLLIFHSDYKPFSVKLVTSLFQSQSGFRDMCFDEPGGALVEAQYFRGQDSTIVRLSHDSETISVTGTSDVSLHAAMLVREHFAGPLRIIDTDYSFDLLLSDYADVAELSSAIDNAQAG